MKMKFEVGNIPIDCILGNIFLVVVEPHGSSRLQDSKAVHFISVPNNKGFLFVLFQSQEYPPWFRLCKKLI